MVLIRFRHWSGEDCMSPEFLPGWLRYVPDGADKG